MRRGSWTPIHSPIMDALGEEGTTSIISDPSRDPLGWLPGLVDACTEQVAAPSSTWWSTSTPTR